MSRRQSRRPLLSSRLSNNKLQTLRTVRTFPQLVLRINLPQSMQSDEQIRKLDKLRLKPKEIIKTKIKKTRNDIY